MKKLVMLNCRSPSAWYGALACFGRVHDGSETLFLPVLEDHQFVRERIRAFAVSHEVDFEEGALEKTCVRSPGPGTPGLGIGASAGNPPSGNHKACLFSCSLCNTTPDCFSSERIAVCPGTIQETLHAYASIHHEVLPEDDIVITAGDAGFVGGSVFSILCRRKMLIAGSIDDIEANLPRLAPATVTLALDNALLSLNNRQRLTDAAVQNDIPLGFLYCYDVETAVWSAVKTRLYQDFWVSPGTQMIVDFTAADTREHKSAGKRYFVDRGNGEHEDLYRALSGRQEAVALTTHSNGMDTFAGERYILCSRKACEGMESEGGRVLPCFHGARCRHARGKQAENQDGSVRVSEAILFCNTLFKHTCWGLALADSVFEQKYSHSHLLLRSEKVNACILADRLCSSSPQNLLCFYFLYNQGVNLGTITNRLNRLHATLHNEHYPFALMGDPRWAFRAGTQSEVREYRWKRLSGNRFHLTFALPDRGDAGNRAIVVDLGRVGGLNRCIERPLYGFYRTSSESPAAQLEGLIDNSDSRGRLLMARTGDIAPGRADVEVSVHVNANPYLWFARSFDHAAAHLPFWAMFVQCNADACFGRDESLQLAAKDVLTPLPDLMLKLQAASRFLDAITPGSLLPREKCEAMIQECVHSVKVFHGRAIAFVVEFSRVIGPRRITLRWMPFYRRSVKETDFGRCTYCNCPTYLKTYLLSSGGEDARSILNCKSCGMVLDTADLNLDVCIRGDSRLERGASTVQQVSIRNDQSYIMFIDAVMFLDDLSGHRCSMSVVRADVKPGRERRLTFTLEVPDTYEPGCYALSCYVFVNTGFNRLHKHVQVQ